MRTTTVKLTAPILALTLLWTQWNQRSTHLVSPTHSLIPNIQKKKIPQVVAAKINDRVEVQLVAKSFVNAFRERLHALSNCYESGCVPENTEGRDRYFEIGQRIRKELIVMSRAVKKDHFQDEQISEIAREFLQNSDGHVKAAALELISTQSTSSENLQAILNGVILDSDPELIEQGFIQLSRYNYSYDRIQINQAVEETLLHGSPFVAQKIAEQIYSILDETSYPFYTQLASQLDDDSNVKNILVGMLSMNKK